MLVSWLVLLCASGALACTEPDAAWILDPAHIDPAKIHDGYYVAVDGSSSGYGSVDEPWDLVTALAHTSVVQPGDTIWLRGGHYRPDGEFTSRLIGTSASPIVVKSFPGEHAVIELNNRMWLYGAYTWYQDLEFFFGGWINGRVSSEPGIPLDFPGSMAGLVIDNSVGIKLINCVLHDLAGVGVRKDAIDAEVSGCIMYNIGWDGPDRGHGHGIYAQNLTGLQLLNNNIIFNTYGVVYQIYGEAGQYVTGFRVEGNVAFGAGAPAAKGPPYTYVLGGTRDLVAADIVFRENYGYASWLSGPGAALGWVAPNEDIEIHDNYLVGYTRVTGWETVTATGNTFIGGNAMMRVTLDPTQTLVPYTWDNNTYLHQPEAAAPFEFVQGDTLRWDFPGWQANTGLDLSSSFVDGTPSGTRVFVRPNKYEAGRAHVIVYNWSGLGSVSVNLSGVLELGKRYEVYNVQQLDSPVASGTYSGGSIGLPMTAVQPPTPIGAFVTPPPTGPKFNVFLVVTTG